MTVPSSYTDNLIKEMIKALWENDPSNNNDQLNTRAKLFPHQTFHNPLSDGIRRIPYNIFNKELQMTRSDFETLVTREAILIQYKFENMNSEDYLKWSRNKSRSNKNSKLLKELFGEPYYENERYCSEDFNNETVPFEAATELTDFTDLTDNSENSDCGSGGVNRLKLKVQSITETDDIDDDKLCDFPNYSNKFYFDTSTRRVFSVNDGMIEVLEESQTSNIENVATPMTTPPEKDASKSTGLRLYHIPLKWLTKGDYLKDNDDDWSALSAGIRAYQDQVNAKKDISAVENKIVDTCNTNLNNHSHNQSVYDYLKRILNNKNSRAKDSYLRAVDAAMSPCPNQPEVGSEEYYKAAETFALYGTDYGERKPLNQQAICDAGSVYNNSMKRSDELSENRSILPSDYSLVPFSSQNSSNSQRQINLSNSSHSHTQHHQILRNVQQNSYLSSQQSPVYMQRVPNNVYPPVIPITYPYLQQSMSSGIVYTNQYIPPPYPSLSALRGESTHINTSIVQQQFNLVAAGLGPCEILVHNQMLQHRITQYISSMCTRVSSNNNNSTVSVTEITSPHVQQRPMPE